MAKTRANWSNWYEFFLSVLGTMVGLGNVWRFPYVCFHSGGAAFLIPYIICIVVCGMPAMLLELAFSQYSNLGPGKVWIACPLFQGLGYGMVILSFIACSYFNVAHAWSLFYLVASFNEVLPWSTCNNEWNTEVCRAGTDQSNPSSTYNKSDSVNSSSTPLFNQSETLPNHTVTAAEEYWRLHVLQISSGIHEPGYVRWQLLLSLFVAWLLIFLVLIRGIKSAGKVVYVTATVPYILLTALLIRGCLLPGALNGIKYYLIPQWEKLLDIKTWRSALSQVFFSLGIGMGGLSTLSSYNRFHNNCYRDAAVFTVMDTLTSWYAGFIVFVYLGYMSYQSNMPISEVVTEGPGLAFIAFPTAVLTMPLPQLWSAVFFLTLITVCVDSQFVHAEVTVTALTDVFPRSLGNRKLLVTISVCFFSFLLGIPSVTQGGVYVLTLMDWYLMNVAFLSLAAMEVLVVAWLYGVNRLYDDIQLMIGYRIPVVWKPMWLVVTPLLILTLLVAGLVNFTPVNLGSQGYPVWAQVIGWLLALTPILPIPVVMGITLWNENGENLKSKIINATRPRKTWQPVSQGDEKIDHDNADELCDFK